MAARSRIKSKVVRSTIENADVLSMFNSVLGSGEGAPLNLEIVYPKYRDIVRHCDRFIRLLVMLRRSPLMGRFEVAAAHLGAYAEALQSEAAASFAAPDLAALHPPSPLEEAMGRLASYGDVTREEHDAFARVYEESKSCNVVNTVVVTCKNLVPHKKSLADDKALRDRFLTRSAGLTFAPLPDLPALNFKHIYISDAVSPLDRQFLLLILHKMLTVSHDVYDAVSSPDIDVDEFVRVIMTSLDDVKKHIPRCEQAFDKIRESVGLLKGNFGGYYKDFVASNNPTIIMENFVLDVSKNTQSSPKITAQFRRIIGHYRKLASQQAQNPKLRTLFQQVDKNFQELERRSRDAENEAESEAESEAEGADAPPGPGGATAAPGDATAADPRGSQRTWEVCGFEFEEEDEEEGLAAEFARADASGSEATGATGAPDELDAGNARLVEGLLRVLGTMSAGPDAGVVSASDDSDDSDDGYDAAPAGGGGGGGGASGLEAGGPPSPVEVVTMTPHPYGGVPDPATCAAATQDA